MASIDSSLGALDAITPSGIVSQTMNQLKELLWQAPSQDNIKVFNADVGGGMVGAMQYSVLYWLFGYYGAKFVLIIEIVIAFMLVTNRSYVEIGRSVRLFVMRSAPLLAARLSSGRKLLSIKAIPVQGAGRRGRGGTVSVAEPADFAAGSRQQATIVADDGMEEPALIPVPQKTPLFFQLFHGKSDKEYEPSQEEIWEEEEALPFAPKDTLSRRTFKVRTGVHRRTNLPVSDEPVFVNPSSLSETEEMNEAEEPAEEVVMPRFTDFTAQTYANESGFADAEREEFEDEEAPPISGVYGEEEGANPLAAEAKWADGEEDVSESDADDGAGAQRATASSLPTSVEGVEAIETAPKPVKKVPKPYKLPTVNLLDKP